MTELNKITKEYLDRNGITYTFFAEWIGCKSRSRLSLWMNKGTKQLTEDEIKKTLVFLRGDHRISLEEITGVELKDEDSTI